MVWHDISTAPKDTLLLGLREHYSPERKSHPVILGVMYGAGSNAVVDQYGRWSDCTHWAEIPPLPAQNEDTVAA